MLLVFVAAVTATVAYYFYYRPRPEPLIGVLERSISSSDGGATFTLEEFRIQEWSDCPHTVAAYFGDDHPTDGQFLFMRYRFSYPQAELQSFGPLSITHKGEHLHNRSAQKDAEYPREPGVFYYMSPLVEPWQTSAGRSRTVRVEHGLTLKDGTEHAFSVDFSLR